MSWEIFEREARRYEGWYATPSGQRADRAKRNLLTWLLGYFPSARCVLELGCGTGHFTAWLAGKGLKLVGLDRAPAMLVDARMRLLGISWVISDAHSLPFRDGAVDVALIVLTLEFLDDPAVALSEAVRVARQGLVVVALNRWSLGGTSRRRANYRGQHTLLSQARDYTLISLRALTRKAAGERLRDGRCTSTNFPDGLWRVRTPIPLGDVIGMAVVLWPRPYCRPVRGVLGTDG